MSENQNNREISLEARDPLSLSESELEELAKKEEISFYEISFLITPKVDEEGLRSEVEKLERVISQIEGVIVAKEPPRLIQLAYPIKKNESAYFGYILFEAPRAGVKKIPDFLKYEQNILRYLVIKRNRKAWEKTQKQLQEKVEKQIQGQEQKEETSNEGQKPEVDAEKLEETLEEILK